MIIPEEEELVRMILTWTVIMIQVRNLTFTQSLYAIEGNRRIAKSRIAPIKLKTFYDAYFRVG